MEELQLPALTDEQILGDGIDVADLGNGLASVTDDAGIDEVQGDQMLDCNGAADGVVVPGTSVDDRSGSALR